MKRYIIILLILFAVSCTSESNYQEEFNIMVLLSVASKMPADPQAACINNMTSSENCLVNSSNPPAPINEASLSSILSSGTLTTYAGYCSGMLASSSFAKFSDLAKVCIMDCQKGYWDSRISAGTCSADFAAQLSGLDEGSKACITDCFKLLNN